MYNGIFKINVEYAEITWLVKYLLAKNVDLNNDCQDLSKKTQFVVNTFYPRDRQTKTDGSLGLGDHSE